VYGRGGGRLRNRAAMRSSLLATASAAGVVPV